MSFLRGVYGQFRNGVSGEIAKILNNAGWLLSDKVVRLVLGVLVGVWVARYLGPQSFGSLNFVIALIALFSPIISLGLDGIVVRDLVRKPRDDLRILSTVFLLRLIGTGFAIPLAIITVQIVRPGSFEALQIVLVLALGVLFQPFDTIDLWFQSKVMSKYTILAKGLAFLISTGLRVTFILLRFPLVAFACAIAVESLLGALGMCVFLYAKANVSETWRPKLIIALDFIKEGWPAILASLSVMLYMRIDQVMLGQMLGDREVGLYSAALRLSEIWYVIPSILTTSAMPAITRLKAQSSSSYELRNEQLLKALVLMAYVLSITVFFFSSPLVLLLYGSEFARSGSVLSIHIWTAVFVFLGVGASPWLVNEGLIGYTFLQTVIGACLNVVLNFALIPYFGAVGAAVATLVTQFFASFLLNLVVPKLRRLFSIQARALIRPF